MTVSRTVRSASLSAALCVALCSDAVGQQGAWSDLGFGLGGSNGTPSLAATPARYGRMLNLHVDGVAPLALSVCVLGTTALQAPVFGGVVVPDPILVLTGTPNPTTRRRYQVLLPDVCLSTPVDLFAQVLVLDPAAPQDWAFSNAIWATVRDNISSDFNGDGYGDLAVGVPAEHVAGLVDAGAVNVVYGSATGLAQASNELLRPGKDVNGLLAGVPESYAFYGRSLSTGDFNGDGFDDLAIGIPSKDTPAINDCGMVHVIFGSAFGLQGGGAGPNDVQLSQGIGVGNQRDPYDRFGASVAAGDLNGDGFDDLLIGAPGEDLFGSDTGIVHVAFGAATGFSGTTDYFDPTGQASGDAFGDVVLLADLDGDGLDDVIVSKPGEHVNGEAGAGAVAVIRTDFHQNITFHELHRDQVFGNLLVAESSQAYDAFGSSLAAADFDRDGALDLAVGVPGDDINGVSSAGSVQLFRYLPSGVHPVSDQVWHQEVPGVMGTAHAYDSFGSALTTYDHDLDGYPDLAIGAHLDRLLGVIPTGAVNVLRANGSNGLTATNDALLTYTGLGLGVATNGMEFGRALSAGRFAGTCDDRLVIGIPDAEVNGVTAGAIAVTGGGLPTVEWSQGPLNGAVSSGDRFGAALGGGR
jgi:hypothetical protein